MKRNDTQSEIVLHIMQELGKMMRIFQNETVLCEGVTFIQFCILDHAAKRGCRLEMSELHRLLSVEKSTTTRMVNPLVERKLAVREKSINDSRAIDLVLTPKGKEIHKKVLDCLSGFIHNVLEHIPKDQHKNVIESLEVFIKSIRNCCGGKSGNENF